MRVLFLPVGHSRNPVLVSDPGEPLGHSRNLVLVSDPGGPLGHSRNPVLVSDPLGPLAPFLLNLTSSCRPPYVGEDVDVIQPQGVQTSLTLTGPKVQYFFRRTKVLIKYFQRSLKSEAGISKNYCATIQVHLRLS
jgi:hypothetical protein